MDTKKCHICKSEKPLIDFTKDKTRPGGLTNRCRSCNRIKNAKYRAITDTSKIRPYSIKVPKMPAQKNIVARISKTNRQKQLYIPSLYTSELGEYISIRFSKDKVAVRTSLIDDKQRLKLNKTGVMLNCDDMFVGQYEIEQVEGELHLFKILDEEE